MPNKEDLIDANIDEEFEKLISEKKAPSVPEETALIPFRDWEQTSKYQQVYKVPIEICRFRLENGRIASKVKTYEAQKGDINQKNYTEREEIIRNFLKEHNPKKNDELENLIKNAGQKEPAVITSDGYLLNGNRRKYVMEKLIESEGNIEKFNLMKVVILPGTGNPERPTLKDLQKIEYHYQVATKGIAEYSNLDKALTYKHSIDQGMQIIDLLKSDDRFKQSEADVRDKELKRINSVYLNPLKLVDDFLEYEETPGDYESIHDRWDSFVEASQKIFSHIRDEKKRENFCVKYKIQVNELGELENSVFNLMKIDSPYTKHSLMTRDVLKWLETDKKKLKEIGKVSNLLDEDKKNNDFEEQKRIWQNTKGKEITNLVKELSNRTKKKEDREDPIDRLTEAIKKLTHPDLSVGQLTNLDDKDTEMALKLIQSVEARRKEIYNCLLEHQKQLKESIRMLRNKK